MWPTAYLGCPHLSGCPVTITVACALLDGGIWANNPSIVVVSEAVSEFGIDLTDIRVLSLGTTSELG